MNKLMLAINAALMAFALALVMVASEKIEQATRQAQGRAYVAITSDFDI